MLLAALKINPFGSRRMQLLALLLSLFVSVLCLATEIPVEDGVLVLGNDNFEFAINEHKNLLVEFYAPWCGHCKALAPEYAKAAKALADSPVKLAKVDSTVHGDIGKRFGVKGFPTLKFFKNGKANDYNGGRTEKEILRWLEKKTGPATTTISTADELDKFQVTHEVFTLGMFDSVDSLAAKAFLAAADGDEAHTYAIATSADVRSKLAVSGDTVVVLKTFDDNRVDLPVPAGGLSSEAITKFVTKQSTPWIQEFSQESSKAIFGSPIKQHVLFFTDKAAAHHDEVLSAYREVAMSFLGEFLFVNVPSTEAKVLEFFGIASSDVPTMVLANMNPDSGILKFPFPEGAAHSTEAIAAFLNDYNQGKLVPHLNSEDVLPEDKSGDVIVVKGKSFQEIVLDSSQDVLVEFYAPWCGHCKQLAPNWDALGKSLKEHKDKVIIAKMDATANEVNIPGLIVKGFPTIYFFASGDKSHPVKYEEKRELDDFLQFLEKNGHAELGLTAAEAGSGKDEL